jgi:hypothetical protein
LATSTRLLRQSRSVRELAPDGTRAAALDPDGMDRLILIAKLRAGSEADALRTVEDGPPFAIDAMPFERHSVHIAAGTVIFVFEGEDCECLVQDIVNDPVVGAALSAWAQLLDGTPTIAQPAYAWTRRAPAAALSR